MKTCRFCLNQQEKGDFCEACGSPLESDNLDFSGAQFPDPTMSAQPQTAAPVFVPAPAPVETVSPAAPAPAAPAPATPDLPPIMQPQTAQPQIMQPQIEQAVPAMGAAAVPQATQPAQAQEPVKQGRKVMYSAKQAGETVYMKNKGVYHPVTVGKWEMSDVPVASESGTAANPVAEKKPTNSFAVPTNPKPPFAEVVAPEQPGVKEEYKKAQSFSLTMLIISSLSMVFCCGTSLISLILSILAYSKSSKVCKGGSTTPDQDVASAKKLANAALVLRIVGTILMIVLIFFIDTE